MMRPLTIKQRAIFDFLSEHVRERGFPPTLREIGEAIGLSNVSAVRGHVEALEKKGYIAKDPEKARSIRIVHSPSILSRFKKKLHKFARTDEGVLHKVVYGIALVTHSRHAFFTAKRAQLMDKTLGRRATEHGWTFRACRIQTDHIVLVVEVWPNHSPELVVSRIRQAGQAVRKRSGGVFAGRALWERGYAITTDLAQLDAMVKQLLEGAKAPSG